MPPVKLRDLEVDRVIENQIRWWIELKHEAAQLELDFDDCD